MTSNYALMGTRNNTQPNYDSTSHFTGMVGDGDFIRWCAFNKYHLYKGFDGHAPVDYIVDTGNVLLRTEVKRIEAIQHTNQNYYYVTATGLKTKNFDYIFVSTNHGCYFIPSSDCPEQTLSIKVAGDDYKRNISRPGKYYKYKVEMPK